MDDPDFFLIENLVFDDMNTVHIVRKAGADLILERVALPYAENCEIELSRVEVEQLSQGDFRTISTTRFSTRIPSEITMCLEPLRTIKMNPSISLHPITEKWDNDRYMLSFSILARITFEDNNLRLEISFHYVAKLPMLLPILPPPGTKAILSPKEGTHRYNTDIFGYSVGLINKHDYRFFPVVAGIPQELVSYEADKILPPTGKMVTLMRSKIVDTTAKTWDEVTIVIRHDIKILTDVKKTEADYVPYVRDDYDETCYSNPTEEDCITLSPSIMYLYSTVNGVKVII